MGVADALASVPGASFYGGWQARGSHPFTPIGIMVHHDVDPNTAQPGTLTRMIAESGSASTPAPLANIHLLTDGTPVVIASGKANHAGLGSGAVLARTQAGLAPEGDAGALGLPNTIGGNGFYLGIEVEHPGDDSDYPQIGALVSLLAHLCGSLGFSPNQVVHHREWTSRKIDMSYRGDLRGQVAEALTNPGGSDLTAAFESEAITILRSISQTSYLLQGGGRDKPGFSTSVIGIGEATRRDVAAVAAQIKALEGVAPSPGSGASNQQLADAVAAAAAAFVAALRG